MSQGLEGLIGEGRLTELNRYKLAKKLLREGKRADKYLKGGQQTPRGQRNYLAK